MKKYGSEVRHMSGLWFEVTAISNKEDAEIKDIEGNHVYIRGNIDDLLIVQVPPGSDHQTLLAGIQRMLQAEGLDKGVFVIDDAIEMMKLVPVSRDRAKVMEAKHQAMKAERTKQNAPTTRTKQ